MVDDVDRTFRAGCAVVVVVSARRGVTHLLRQALHSFTRPAADTLVRTLRHRHPDLPAEGRRWLTRAQSDWARLSVTVSPAEEDRWLSLGERLAAHWMEARLRRRGLPAVAIESDALGVITDGRFGAARIDLERSRRPVRRRLVGLLAQGKIPVVTGYFGADSRGRVTTLGPGGSDYSATALSALLPAKRVDLVKSRFSILTADPAVVPAARPVRHVSYLQAEELAQFGASVLHPAAMEPARQAQVPIRVRTLGDPAQVTVIDGSPGGAEVWSVAWLGPFLLARLEVPGGRARPSVARRLLEELEVRGVSVAGVSTSQSTIQLLLDPSARRPARTALTRAAIGGRAELRPLVRVSVVTLLGRNAPRALSRLPPELLSASFAVEASPRSVSIVLPASWTARGCRVLHRLFVEPRAPLGQRNT